MDLEIFNKHKEYTENIAKIFYDKWRFVLKTKTLDDFVQIALTDLWIISSKLDTDRTDKEQKAMIYTSIKNRFINLGKATNNYEILVDNNYLDSFPNKSSKDDVGLNVSEIMNDLDDEKERKFCELLLNGHNISESAKIVGWSRHKLKKHRENLKKEFSDINK